MSKFLNTRSRSLLGGCFLLLLISGAAAPGKPLPPEHTVEIKQMQFQPAELKVQKGDIVIFINRDLVEHNVTEASHKSWSSSALPAGSSWKLVVTQSANYYCTIHPVMKGKLLVK
jgi:plastocyanin